MTADHDQTNRMGVLGGTFDPVHVGHVLIAMNVMETFALDRVLFIPSGSPPHKNADALADAAHRLEMVRLATAWNPAFEVSDLEIRRPGTTYTIDTLAELRVRYPHTDIHLIIGTDTLLLLHTWKRIADLLEQCRLITCARPGDEEVRPDALKLPAPWPDRLVEGIHIGPRLDIASTDIRARSAAKKSIRFLVPEAVEAYIADRQLYK